METWERFASDSLVSLDGDWLLCVDPGNIGLEREWFAGTLPDVRPTRVPGTIQEVFPGYHGVAWYSRSFTPATKPYPEGRYLLRFWAVDYLAQVWLNGIYAGGHEGGEAPFTLDITDIIEQKSDNLLVVWVLNPTNEPIDGIILKQTPHRNKVVPYVTGGSYNHGGIVQPVELIYAPAVRVTDVFARPDIASGQIQLQTTVRNDNTDSIMASLEASVASAAGGSTIVGVSGTQNFPKGNSIHNMELHVPGPHLWDVDDPYLYRVTVRLGTDKTSHEQSIRCGFRDFCFRDGYFWLNDRRIYLRSAHTGNHYPIGMQLPHDMELLRRDLYYAKVVGFNMVRFIAGMAWPSQLDFCDELGLMVYEESYAGWCMEDSPQMAERFDRSTSEMIQRDRNHPSMVIWGLLNETPDGNVFRHAMSSLPLVRSLDDTRMLLLNSGRWDGRWSIGSICNPGSSAWEHLLGAEGPEAPDVKGLRGGYLEGAGDAHYYPPIPLSADSIRFFRTLGADTKNVFLSEHGNGGEVDAIRVVRLYEQAGARPDLEDYVQYRSEADRFMADWERFDMNSVFTSPGDFMLQSQRVQAEQRLVGLNAIRSNPNLCGYSLTGLCDQGMTAEGLWTTFRELKPGMMESIRDGFAPLRWCLFVEPVHGYRGQTFTLEAVLANEDVLLPGEYPACFRVIGPDGTVLERTRVLKVSGNESDMVLPIFYEEMPINAPAGRYEIVAYLERGAAPAGGRSHFFVSDPLSSAEIHGSITVWGDEERLGSWLEDKGISYRNFADPAPPFREVILVGASDGISGDHDGFRELARRIFQGSSAIFLSPKVFRKDDKPLGWLPLAVKGELRQTQGWAAGRDDFAKAHPIFDGLPVDGLLDMMFYRDLIPGQTFNGQEMPEELVAGAFAVGSYQPGGYYSGMHIAVYPLGLGRFIINSLLVLENLGKHPAADRLALNFIRYAACVMGKPLMPLPDDFNDQLGLLGY